ncbi:hypothetical protein [Methanobrevibacter sp. DSM 116169]|uniref:hypothetical protein n=1 Tax=Methanobrevibacter sp. DSM 116169 TaxID=3242727 RepID=UPI0038FCD4D7
MSEDKINKLINLKEPIPNRIENMLNDNIPTFRRRRLLAGDVELDRLDRKERIMARDMSIEEAGKLHTKLALDFVEKHPDFKNMIKEVVRV